ncbi:MAG: Gfo/Idh/MocA family oxidoreductase [Armatimonadetes bacterium]|nr:Gfo/Idh/MocA family oxidoreductase [Armatimonadota bacterium]
MPDQATSQTGSRPSIGVVGAGAWGKNIVKTLSELGALGGISEVSAERRHELREQYDVPVVGDPEELIDIGLNGVCIAAPAPVHHPLAKMFLLEGLHTFVEKPLTLSVIEAEELNDLAEQNGRVLMVGHLLMYQPAIQAVKELIDSGKVGRLFSLNHERLNLGRARRVENVLWSLGVHDVAVCLYLAGEAPMEVRASGQCMLQPTIEDDVRLSLEFPSGVRGNIHSSWMWPSMRRRLTVVGDAGMLVYDEVAQTVTFHDKGISADLSNRNDGEAIVFEGAGQPLTLEMEHFLECCANGTRPISDGVSGLEVVRVLEQAFPSDQAAALAANVS